METDSEQSGSNQQYQFRLSDSTVSRVVFEQIFMDFYGFEQNGAVLNKTDWDGAASILLYKLT